MNKRNPMYNAQEQISDPAFSFKTGSDRISLQERVKRFFSKGNLANMFSFTVLVLGVFMKFLPFIRHWFITELVFNAGLFGFAGGITNWIAIKMLFDRVPFLIGSGVIPRKFKLIRKTIKDIIINTFFDSSFLSGYVKRQAGVLVEGINVEAKIGAILNSQKFDIKA